MNAKSQLDALCLPESKEGGYVWNATHGTLSKCIDDVWVKAGPLRITKCISHGWYDENGNKTTKGGSSKTVFQICFKDGTESTATFKGMSSAAIIDEIKRCVQIAADNGALFSEEYISVAPVKVSTKQGTHNEPVINQAE